MCTSSEALCPWAFLGATISRPLPTQTQQEHAGHNPEKCVYTRRALNAAFPLNAYKGQGAIVHSFGACSTSRVILQWNLAEKVDEVIC